jgi:uncharacterized membrane protein (DUF485 family)
MPVRQPIRAHHVRLRRITLLGDGGMTQETPGGGRAPLSDEMMHRLEALASKRLRVGIMLTAGMLAVYFGFILLVAFNKSGLAVLITDGLSWGILLGILVILATWTLTFTYVGWANRVYEPEITKIKG